MPWAPWPKCGKKWGFDFLKWLGVDYGLARTGLAVSDPEERLAFPLATLRLEDYPDRKEFLAALAERIRIEKVGGVVMGLPLLADGKESLTSRQVRNVTERLKRPDSSACFFYARAPQLRRSLGGSARRRPLGPQAPGRPGPTGGRTHSGLFSGPAP